MFEKTINQNLISIAKAYRRATRKSWALVSKEFYGNSTFFDKLRNAERTVSVRVAGQMLEQFRDKWPANARWPKVQPIFMTREEM